MANRGLAKDAEILIVDDSAEARNSLRSCLRAAGYTNVVEATGGDDAFDKLKKSRGFKVIISDYNMPKGNGLDFLKKVREDYHYKGIYFLMITGQADKEVVETSMQHGTSDFIVKPFTPDTIYGKLDRLGSGKS